MKLRCSMLKRNRYNVNLKFGVSSMIHHRSYKFVSGIALAAEKFGFDSFWLNDHYFIPRAVGYEGDPWESSYSFEPWITLTAIAGNTKRITLGTRVCPIPYYHPPKLAKLVATLDIISGGRVVFGAGAGYFKEEALSYGFTWDKLQTRVQKMREGLYIIKKLWTKENTTYMGKHYNVVNAPFLPKPLQKPHPPIWMGGSSTYFIEAAIDLGDGWFLQTDTSLDQFRLFVSSVKKHAKNHHKDLSKIVFAPQFTCNIGDPNGGTPEDWIDKIEKFNKSGAKHILIYPFPPPKKHLSSLEKPLDWIKFFSKKVISYFKADYE